MNCPGCGAPIDEPEVILDQIDVYRWGAKEPHRQLERDTLYCARCDRVLVVAERDVTPPPTT